MSNQPPDSGQPPESGQPGPQPGQPGPPGPPPGPPPGFPPPAYGQPLWQGHQAPQQGEAGGPAGPGWQPYGAPQEPRRGRRRLYWLLGLLALALVAVAVVAVLVLAGDRDGGGVAVSELDAGDCLTSPDLADAQEEIGEIEVVGCDDEHDAEVFAVLELEADEDLDAAGTRCVEAAAEAGRPLEDLQAEDLEVRPLSQSDAPQQGDEIVCFIRHRDGEPLSGSEFR